MTTLFGIPNCDTIKKAKTWLTNQQIEFTFHDYRKQGVSEEWLLKVEAELGWEKMLNKRGTTFRQLPDEIKQNIDKATALKLLAEHPAMIKRPILEHVGQFYIGFSTTQYEDIFNS